MSDPIILTRHHIWLYAAAAVLALIALGAWEEGRHDSAKLAATIEAQKKVIAHDDAQAKALTEERAARDAAADKKLEDMRGAIKEIQTSQQIAKWIPGQLATTQPITIQVPAATAANPKPDAVATIPQSALPELRDAIEGCKECGVKLTTAQKDLATDKEQLRVAGEKLGAVTKERDEAISTAKGGSWWTRTKRIAKWGALFFAMGYAAHR
jgi:hypothetical protein